MNVDMSVICHAVTHWRQVTHICVSKLNSIGSDNGLSPGRCQVIIWTNAGTLSICNLDTNLREILSEIPTFSSIKIQLKMSAKWRQFCLDLIQYLTAMCRLWKVWNDKWRNRNSSLHSFTSVDVCKIIRSTSQSPVEFHFHILVVQGLLTV